MASNIITFNAYRTLGIPGVHYIKPELMFANLDTIRCADWVLFPEYWQVNSLVYGMGRTIFPNVNTYHLGHDKVEMTRAFWSVAPEHVPQTEILPANDNSFEQVLELFDFPLVAKEVRNSMGRGVHLIEDRAALRRYVAQNDILYIQEYLPLDRDLRIIVIGEEAVCAYWREEGDGFHFNVARGGVLNTEAIPPQAVNLALKVAKHLGINHAGFDVAMVGDYPYLLEFNVLFGTDGPNQLGIDLPGLIHRYMQHTHQLPAV